MPHHNRLKEMEDNSESEEDNDDLDNDNLDTNDDDYYSDDDDEGQKNEIATENDESIPLYQRLAALQSESYHTSKSTFKRNTYKSNHKAKNDLSVRRDKNAPMIMRSNKQVPILRPNSFQSHSKFVDPRFSEATGKLDYSKFMKNYQFLDEMQEKEVNEIEKTLKKTKNQSIKQDLKKTLDRSVIWLKCILNILTVAFI